MSSRFELPVTFSDSTTVVIKEGNLVLKVPVLARAVNVATEKDLEQDIIVSAPVEIPFPSKSGQFLFDHVRSYAAPDSGDNFSTIEEYKEAAQLSKDELRDILELANYLECLDFVQAIGFVIADKLKELPVEQIANFMGVAVLDQPDGWDEDREWMEDAELVPPAENQNEDDESGNSSDSSM